KRPLGIIVGFIGAFTLFALLSRQLLEALHADPQIVRNVALVMLVVFGIVMLSKRLSDKLLGATTGLANFGQNLTARWDQKNGFFSGVAIGALIGLIWAPCAGPIMAAAIVQIIQAKTNAEAVLTVVMFAVGAGIPMLVIALLGRQVMARLSFLKTHSYGVRRVLGVVIIAAAVLIYEGADVQLLASSQQVAPAINDNQLHMALDNPYPAPEITGVSDWINSPPLKIADLKGKVVLIDFWTYSCINCVRTLPYITSWDEKYRDKGLVIIGVHSPEFEFEKKLENVKAATEKFGIKYPVVLDSNLATWSAFNNKYWPAHYLINKDGQVVYTHFGEGEYAITENNIRVLLGLNAEPVAATPENYPKPTSADQSRETYLGYSKAANFSGTATHDASAHYAIPQTLDMHHWALEGDWTVAADSVTSDKKNATIGLNFTARKVFLVLGTKSDQPVHVHVSLNGMPATGADVKDGIVSVDQERLYELLDQGESHDGILTLQADEPGLQAYAFTFGG
ncbi:MAG TPA: cytochrome c biogenesis protein DipZ, partial [Alphaproteobacteria bacterium]|nr:cytochrome c biogenesis protein DipZ [Alphaproteobacteria bacterium]